MTDFHRINTPRVEKIAKMLATIQTSAKSQRAEADLGALLAPIQEALGAILGGQRTEVAQAPQEAAQEAEAAPARPGAPACRWQSLRDVAERAPLADFPICLAVYQNRITDALDEIRDNQGARP